MKNYSNKIKGFSLIEILIYIAILSIIGAILTSYFMTTISSEVEHSKRNALENSIQNINATLKYDLSNALNILEPSTSNTTSTSLIVSSSEGGYEYKVDNKNLIKIFGTTTQILNTEAVEIDDWYFKRRDHFESRLNATTTSIECYFLLSNKISKSMKRTINTLILIGKDSI